MRLLDLFCGAGGAAMGYSRAGFTEIVGVDNRPQKHYPFTFIQADALEYVAEHRMEFDAIHASPPCQAYSVLRTFAGKHPKLIGAVRDSLLSTGLPWVIENVPGSPVLKPITLCGTMFGELGVKRHRLFEASFPLETHLKCDHSVIRNPLRFKTLRHGKWYMSRFCPVYGGGGGKGAAGVKDWGPAMGIDWMANRAELSQAIPPAYTEFVGKQLLAAMR